MKVYRGISEFRCAKGCVVTMGSFDGLHVGHGAIFSTLKSLSQKLNAPSAVITFDPHPRMVVGKPNNTPILLTTLNEKIEILDKLGIDNLFIIEFTPEFASLSYEQFVKTYLVDILSVKGVVLGYNHHFGNGREGGYDILKSLGEKYGFEVAQVEKYSINEYKISSTNIRNFLSEGDVVNANTLLIDSFSFSGRLHNGVVLDIDNLKILPKEGCYEAFVNGVLCNINISSDRVVTIPNYKGNKDGNVKLTIIK